MQQRHENRKTYFQELATTSELHFLPYIHRFTSVLPKPVLEIGCGEGGNLVPFARIGCRVTGIDLSENRIRQARQFFQEERLPATFIASDIFSNHTIGRSIRHHTDSRCYRAYLRKIPPFRTYQTLPHSRWTTLYQLPSLANAFEGISRFAGTNMFHACLSFIYCPQTSTAVYYTTLAKAERIDELLDIRKCRTSIELFEKLLCTSHYRIFHKQFWFINRITNKNFTLNRVNCHVSSVRYRICAIFSVPHAFI